MHKILSLNLLILLYLNIVLFHFYYIYFSFILHFKFLFDFCNFYWYTKLKGGILMEILDSNIESLETSEEIITEKKLEELYQVKTRIVYIPEVGRKVCVVAEQ